MLNLDPERMRRVAQEAFTQVAGNGRWQRAISRALVELEVNQTFMERQGDALLIWSQRSDEIYGANGTCQCKAFQRHQPCWHRALARLVQRYDQAH